MLGVAFAILILVPGCASSALLASHRSDGSGEPDLDRIARATELANDHGRRHPTVFAGVFIEGSDVILLWVADHERMTQDFKDTLPAHTFDNVMIRGRKAARTIEDLQSIHSLIMSQMPAWRGRGIEITGIGIAIDLNRVRVTLASNSAGARRVLEAEYGQDVLVFETGAFRPL